MSVKGDSFSLSLRSKGRKTVVFSDPFSKSSSLPLFHVFFSMVVSSLPPASVKPLEPDYFYCFLIEF